MAAAVQRKQRLSDDADASGVDGVIQQSAAQEHPKGSGAAAVTAAAAAVRHLHKQTLFKRVQQKLAKLRSWLWYWIGELFEVSSSNAWQWVHPALSDLAGWLCVGCEAPSHEVAYSHSTQ
jgi:hypothetical protein